MPISMYEACVPTVSRALTNLRAVLRKASEQIQANDINPDAIMSFRLFPNMLPFRWQVYIATDTAKLAAARLGEIEAPVFTDDQVTFADLDARIGRTLEFLAAIKPEQIDGSEDKDITIEHGTEKCRYTGQRYLLGYVLPNLYFHVTTAYGILRHNGIDIGKKDYMGDI